jgi:putative phosphoribosyl transferase
VRRRVKELRAGLGPVVAPGDAVLLVDDGLASGTTMALAVEALREAGAGRIVVAVPTGSASAVRRLGSLVDELVCANVRSGWSFAVADAYEAWSDVEEETVREVLERSRPAP